MLNLNTFYRSFGSKLNNIQKAKAVSKAVYYEDGGAGEKTVKKINIVRQVGLIFTRSDSSLARHARKSFVKFYENKGANKEDASLKALENEVKIARVHEVNKAFNASLKSYEKKKPDRFETKRSINAEIKSIEDIESKLKKIHKEAMDVLTDLPIKDTEVVDLNSVNELMQNITKLLDRKDMLKGMLEGEAITAPERKGIVAFFRRGKSTNAPKDPTPLQALNILKGHLALRGTPFDISKEVEKKCLDVVKAKVEGIKADYRDVIRTVHFIKLDKLKVKIRS